MTFGSGLCPAEPRPNAGRRCQNCATASQSTQVHACFADTAYLGVVALSSREADRSLAFVWAG